MAFKHLALPLLSLFLISCGGGGSDSPKEPPSLSAAPPVVTLSVDSASIDESSSIVITHSAKDYQGTTISSELSCDVGTLDGNNYTAPSVATETTATCTATATDSDNRSATETFILTINTLTPILTLMDNEENIVAAQIITLDVGHALIANESLAATLDGNSIQLARLNDTQLAFIFPLITPDTHSLTTVIENESVTLSFSSQAASVPWVDSSTYLDDYLQELNTSLDQLESLGGGSLDTDKLNELREFINPDGEYFSSLSEQDKELLAHMIYQNVVPMMEEKTLQFKSSVQKSYSLKKNFTSDNPDSSCIALGLTALAIQNGTIGSIAIVVISGGTLSLHATAALAIINIANYAVIWPAAENACTRPFNTVFDNFSADLEGLDRMQNIQLPMKTSMNQKSEVLDFFSHEPKKLLAKRQYEIITGNEEDFQNIINSFNSVGTHVRKLISYLDANPLPVIGKVTVPSFLEDFFSESISFEDIRYEDISPSNLNVTTITGSDVTGGDITDRNENNFFDLTFSIDDLEVPHIAFQFTITDSGHNAPLSTVIDAEVTLNPPLAYSETFAAVLGEDMTARLQADFETGFEIKTQPQKGILDISGAFSHPGGGLFTYTPDETITEDTTDSFTFVATNGSTKNGGESNEATVTLEIGVAKYQVQLAASSSSDNDDIVYQTISSGDEVTLPNGVKLYAGLTLNGQLVGVKTLGEATFNFWAYFMPNTDLTTEDVTMDYNFRMNDVLNNKVIDIPVKLTLSNEGFRTLINQELTITGSNASSYKDNPGSIVLHDDLTYTADGPFGVKSGTWRATDYYHIPSYPDRCSDNNSPDPGIKSIGHFKISGATSNFYAAEFLEVREGGTFETGQCQSAENPGYLGWYE